MLSVLIPTYHYDTLKLVKDIHSQILETEIPFEILVFDDASKKPPENNIKINELQYAQYIVLKENLGRSAIRNLLAKTAKFDWLLFLDADTQINNAAFIFNYLQEIKEASHQIVYGGIQYQTTAPEKEERLRWIYGKKREALSLEERVKNPYLRFLTLNFLIKKSVFQVIQFNTDIPNLRHEDTLFALDARKNDISIKHIDNPVLHLGLESSKTFLLKSEESVEVLHQFISDNLLKPRDTKLSRMAEKLKRNQMTYPVLLMYKLFGKKMRTQLLSKSPSLFIFDVYRLGYYLSLSK